MFSSLVSSKYVFHASKYPLHLVVSEGVVAKTSLGRALFANIFARFRRSVRGSFTSSNTRPEEDIGPPTRWRTKVFLILISVNNQ